jgi:hypothetical protein
MIVFGLSSEYDDDGSWYDAMIACCEVCGAKVCAMLGTMMLHHRVGAATMILSFT